MQTTTMRCTQLATSVRPDSTFLKALLLIVLLTGSVNAAHATTTPTAPVVAVATSVNAALSEIIKAFAVETGKHVRLSFGSSGNITRQIIRGAPFELFLSADEHFVRTLHQRGLTQGAGRVYALGRVVLYTAHGSAIAGMQVGDLPTALNDGRLQQLAIAHPEHAPYGRAAREVLQQLGLWQRINSRLIMGENVAQATQFAATGSVDGGLIAHATALAPRIAQRGAFVMVPATMHRPLRHRMVLLRGAGPVAKSFYAFMQSETAHGLLSKYGLQVPAAER